MVFVFVSVTDRAIREGVGYVKTQLSYVLVYYADDMFRPLRVIFRSQKYFFPPVPPLVLCGLRGPPSWAWQECNRLRRLGRP